MIHDWIVYDDQHQACRRCGLRLWRRGAGAWQAVTSNGVPAPFGLLPDGSRLECTPPRNQLPGLVVIDYTGDPDFHPGCERFMHRVRDEADPGGEVGVLAVPCDAPTACGFPAVAWELGPPRLHPGWTWCLDCFPERAGARQRLAQPPHVAAGELAQLAREERRDELAQLAREYRSELGNAKRKAKAEAKRNAPLRYCHCPKCAGGWPSRDETIREVRSITRRPQGWNPK